MSPPRYAPAQVSLPRLLPSVTSFITFILGMLLIFAGTQRKFLPQADLLTLNLPDTDLPDGVPDFFKVYLLSYCQGTNEECVTEDTNTTSIVTKLIDCSDRDLLFTFNPGDAIASALGLGPDDPLPSGLDWPGWIDDDFDTLGTTGQAMSVLYVIGTTGAGVSIAVSLWTMWSASPLSPPSTIQFLVLLTSMMSLGIATIIANVISAQFVSLIDKSGQDEGISADHGEAFLALSWAAMGFQTLGTVASLISILVYRAKHCRCDWDEGSPASPDLGEHKPLVEG
ncbi:SUR7/PalI family protein [Aspergillus affinis]|uniref:SUR7/PalI family protein n=1 Tax=Aspergillus affinis TaxID=1070780 RepID=UPI0022FE57FA|nr:uncharacterized protein KD926_001740 [Aspergillus affinis]KAI9036529.1 hypothetical protein KD926_001740 [Aspergillus affinis]